MYGMIMIHILQLFKYVQRAYDLFCDYCKTQNYYSIPSEFCRKIIYCNKYVQRDYDLLQLLIYTELLLYLFYLYLLWLLRYTELLLYLPSEFCRKINYCNNYVRHDYDILQLLQYTELLLNLPS
jgi:hypothetical protein